MGETATDAADTNDVAVLQLDIKLLTPLHCNINRISVCGTERKYSLAVKGKKAKTRRSQHKKQAVTFACCILHGVVRTYDKLQRQCYNHRYTLIQTISVCGISLFQFPVGFVFVWLSKNAAEYFEQQHAKTSFHFCGSRPVYWPLNDLCACKLTYTNISDKAILLPSFPRPFLCLPLNHRGFCKHFVCFVASGFVSAKAPPSIFMFYTKFSCFPY